LKSLFGLQLVKSEFELKGLRIDTLAFDPESRGFIIVEYKRDRNFSVVDQGMAYLNLMLNNKADFILEYNERTTPNLKREDVDWTQTRVIFVAPEFTSISSVRLDLKTWASSYGKFKSTKMALLFLTRSNLLKPQNLSLQ
jgi:hypothetical protein